MLDWRSILALSSSWKVRVSRQNLAPNSSLKGNLGEKGSSKAMDPAPRGETNRRAPRPSVALLLALPLAG